MWMIMKAVGLLFDVLYYMIIARVLLSWVVRNPYNKYYSILIQVTEPILLPFRNLMNKFAGGRMNIDLSPIFAIIALNILRSIIMKLLIGMAF